MGYFSPLDSVELILLNNPVIKGENFAQRVMKNRYETVALLFFWDFLVEEKNRGHSELLLFSKLFVWRIIVFSWRFWWTFIKEGKLMRNENDLKRESEAT